MAGPGAALAVATGDASVRERALKRLETIAPAAPMPPIWAIWNLPPAAGVETRASGPFACNSACGLALTAGLV